jgi:serine/threonine protein kinase
MSAPATLVIVERNIRRAGIRKTVFTLESGAGLLVGRHPQAHLRIEDPSISRQHVKLIYHEGRLYVEDISKNGSLINRRRVKGREEIGSHDALFLGDTVLRFELDLDMTQARRSLTGQVLAERYRLVELVGRGRFSKVFRALRLDDETEVAVKVLASPYNERQSLVERFEHAARLARELVHPGVIRLLDSSSDSARGLHFTVHDLVMGETLKKTLNEGNGLPYEQVMAIAEQLGAAIEYLHQQQIVHRNVTPANVMIDDSGRVRLGGLGLVKAIEDDCGPTRPGDAMGTIPFAAPEQLLDAGDVDERADVYGFAAVIYWALSGRAPIVAKTRHELFSALAEGQPATPLATLVSDPLPRALEVAIAGALSHDPGARPRSLRELLAAIDVTHQPTVRSRN